MSHTQQLLPPGVTLILLTRVSPGCCRSYNYFANRGKLYENKLCARASFAREKGEK